MEGGNWNSPNSRGNWSHMSPRHRGGGYHNNPRYNSPRGFSPYPSMDPNSTSTPINFGRRGRGHYNNNRGHQQHFSPRASFHSPRQFHSPRGGGRGGRQSTSEISDWLHPSMWEDPWKVFEMEDHNKQIMSTSSVDKTNLSGLILNESTDTTNCETDKSIIDSSVNFDPEEIALDDGDDKGEEEELREGGDDGKGREELRKESEGDVKGQEDLLKLITY